MIDKGGNARVNAMFVSDPKRFTFPKDTKYALLFSLVNNGI